MVSKYLIYGLVDPKSNELRYVGRSSSGLNRPRMHSRPSSLKANRDYCHFWVEALLKNGLTPEILVLEQFESSADVNDRLNDAEVFWIAYFRYIGARLTNMTTGGGHPVVCEESRIKQSMARKGRKRSPEARANISAGKKGKKFSPTHVENMSRSRLGKKRSQEEKDKISASMKGMQKTEEHLRNLAVAAKTRKYTPEGKAKIALAAKLREARKRGQTIVSNGLI